MESEEHLCCYLRKLIINYIKEISIPINYWVLIIYATSCVSLLSFAIRSYNYSKMPSIREILAQNAIRYLKNAIVKLDVC